MPDTNDAAPEIDVTDTAAATAPTDPAPPATPSPAPSNEDLLVILEGKRAAFDAASAARIEAQGVVNRAQADLADKLTAESVALHAKDDAIDALVAQLTAEK